jgi:hypothetical protein
MAMALDLTKVPSSDLAREMQRRRWEKTAAERAARLEEQAARLRAVDEKRKRRVSS